MGDEAVGSGVAGLEATPIRMSAGSALNIGSPRPPVLTIDDLIPAD